MEKEIVFTFKHFETYMDKFRGDLDDRFNSMENQIQTGFSNLSEQIEDLAFATKTGFDHVDGRFDRLETRMDQAEVKIDVLTTDMNVVKQDVSVLKQDVSVLKQDVSVLKQDVSVLKTDMKEVKQDVFVLKTDMKDCKHYIQSSSFETASNRVRLQNLEAHIA